jgi:hypothetical protein
LAEKKTFEQVGFQDNRLEIRCLFQSEIREEKL